MLQLQQITLRRGTKILLENASAQLNQKQRVGLVGRNGAGKSSLIALLTHELQEDHGSIQVPTNWQMAHLEQSLPATTLSAFDYAKSGDKAYLSIQQAIQAAEAADDHMALAQLYNDLTVIDGYRIDSRVAIILKGLGFTDDQMQQPVSTFSGGWQMRLQLARVLLSRSDWLLLDEPTNHLDLETIMWLEAWLNQYQGLLIVISHDRDFLDQVTTHTLSISHQRLKLYQGNYSSFAKQFQQALMQQQQSNEKILKKQKHLQSFVDRFRAKASKAKQAQGRIKAIAKLAISSELQEEEGVSFQFRDTTPASFPAIRIDASLGYGETIILNKIQLDVSGTDRIAVIGINGSGKSTLLKSVAKQLTPVSGIVTHHPNTRIGYFSQHQLDMLHLNESPIDHLLQQDPRLSESQARTFLGGFGFSHDNAFQPVEQFSGGEKARLALALLIWQKPNVLILDEPTNHLDMHVREALIIALQTFSGAVILVSHDRYFIECCANQLWFVNQGTVTPFDGDLNDYQRSYLANQQTTAQTQTQAPTPTKPNKNTQKRIQRLEREIEQLQQKVHDIEQQLNDNNLYLPDHKQQLDELLKKQQTLNTDLEKKEQTWIQLSDDLS